MKSYADYKMRIGFRRAAKLERQDSIRNVITRGKHLEGVDWNQLPKRPPKTLVNDDGLWWFVVGLSIVGGPDIVPPGS